MSLATCIRFRGPHSFAELNALEQRVAAIDPGVYFLSTSPITSYKDDMESRTDVEGLIQFSTATLRECAVTSLQDAPLGPIDAHPELLQADGKKLTPSVAARYSRLISPLPNGTSKAALLDSVKGHGATGHVGIFQHIGGLVRFPTAEAAKAAGKRAARLQLLVLGEKVNLRAVDERKLFCMELSPEVTEDQLRTLFQKHGVVTHVSMHPKKTYRGRHCRDALITFNSDKSTAAALRANNGKMFHDRPLRLTFGDINGKTVSDQPPFTTPNSTDITEDVPTAAPSEIETLFISELQSRLIWQQRAADYADWHSQAQADVGKALAEMQEIEVTFEAERQAFERERTQWATQRAQLIDDCAQLRNECARLRSDREKMQDERKQLVVERDEALHKFDVAESRRKMLEMDLESSRDKQRVLLARAMAAESALRYSFDFDREEQRSAEEARTAEAEQNRLAREAAEARRKEEEDTRHAQAEAKRQADYAKRQAEEAEQRLRAREEANKRRAEERQARRRAAAAAEEERCLLRDARWPHRWPFSSFTVVNARDRFLAISLEFDSPTHPFSDTHPLVARSVPWLVLAHPAAFDLVSLTWDMVEKFTKAMKGIMTANEYRTFLKNARLRFHPDKWAARKILQAVVDDEMRAQMEVACKTVSQAINDAVREMGGC